MTSQNSSPQFNYEAARQAQEAAQRAEEARRKAERQRQEEAQRKAREAAEREAQFLQDRDSTAATLKSSGSSVATQLKGTDAASNAGGLKGTPGPVVTGLKQGAMDSGVVDARQIPSGLPKGVEKAITTVYAKAVPGVEDRVRKGFQAVMVHDWAVAKAWFEDALHHDPQNTNLQRLVQLTGYTDQHASPPASRGSGKPSPTPSAIQLPQDSDLELLFPGWKPPAAPPSRPSAHKVTGADLVFLFPGLDSQKQRYRVEAKRINEMVFDEMLKAAQNDPVLLRVSNRRPVRLSPRGAGANQIHN